MLKRTKISNAEFVVAFDGKKHRLIPNGTIVYEGNTIVYVGQNYEGTVDETIDASGYLIIPGLIDTHTHLMTESKNKGFLEDTGTRKLWRSGLYEYLFVSGKFNNEDLLAVLKFGLTELLKSGCTTVMEMGRPNEDVVDVFGQSGIRAYVGPYVRDGKWYLKNDHEVLYDWDYEQGKEALKFAVNFIEKHSGKYNDRFRGFLAPGQVDTVSEKLFKEIIAVQKDLKVPIQTHASQSVVEWLEMMRRHGMTPIEWLGSIGFLGEQTIIGHAIFISHHSWINYPDHDDIALLASTGTSVAHAPWCFGRRGQHLESFSKYVRRGVNMSIATDTYPQDMIEEMRWAAVIGKNVEGDPTCPTTDEVFDAATLGGAKALGRDDLGRIAPGAKADMVFINTNTMHMRPLRDPIKNLIYSATSKSVEKVIIDGEIVVEDGKVRGINEEELIKQIQVAAEKIWESVPSNDWAGRTMEQMSPLTYELWDGN